MKLSVLILSVLLIGLNIAEIVGQSTNSNNLIISDLQSLLSKTQQSVRAYLSTILVDAIVKNVDAIFASTSLNLTTVVNQNYGCSRLTTTTTSTSNFYSFMKVKFKIIFMLYISNNINDHYFFNNYNHKHKYLLYLINFI